MQRCSYVILALPKKIVEFTISPEVSTSNTQRIPMRHFLRHSIILQAEFNYDAALEVVGSVWL